MVGRTHSANRPDQEGEARPATINPGEWAELDIETYGGCLDGRPTITWPELTIGLADGSNLPFAHHRGRDLRRGPGYVVPPGRGPAGRPALAPPDRGNRQPGICPIGQTLAYIVTLTNPTNAAIPLSPCPDYEQTLMGSDFAVKTGGYHQLNCAVASIPARGQLRFQMRAEIPASTRGSGRQPSPGCAPATSAIRRPRRRPQP